MWDLKTREEVSPPQIHWGPTATIFTQIHQRALNDIWHIYSSIKTLKTILWFKIFPTKYPNLTKPNYELPLWNLLKIYCFWQIWTIYTSNESWNHFKLINGIEKWYFIENNCKNWFFPNIWFGFSEKKNSKAKFFKSFLYDPKNSLFFSSCKHQQDWKDFQS